MEYFDCEIGAIVELTNHDKEHCGVVVDSHHSVELIATKDEVLRKMICKVVLIDLITIVNHPVNGKPPEYKLRENPPFPWTIPQLKSKIKSIRQKYVDTEYHIIYNNCQHFAWELSTGQKKSPDADKYSLVGGAIGWAFSIKDFGIDSSSSSGSFASIANLEQDLNLYLSL